MILAASPCPTPLSSGFVCSKADIVLSVYYYVWQCFCVKEKGLESLLLPVPREEARTSAWPVSWRYA